MRQSEAPKSLALVHGCWGDQENVWAVSWFITRAAVLASQSVLPKIDAFYFATASIDGTEKGVVGDHMATLAHERFGLPLDKIIRPTGPSRQARPSTVGEVDAAISLAKEHNYRIVAAFLSPAHALTAHQVHESHGLRPQVIPYLPLITQQDPSPSVRWAASAYTWTAPWVWREFVHEGYELAKLLVILGARTRGDKELASLARNPVVDNRVAGHMITGHNLPEFLLRHDDPISDSPLARVDLTKSLKLL